MQGIKKVKKRSKNPDRMRKLIPQTNQNLSGRASWVSSLF